MSDDKVVYLPGVERPCDTEPHEETMLKAANHATDANPNQGSFEYPAIRFCFHRTKDDAVGFWRVYTDDKGKYELHDLPPITAVEALRTARELLEFVDLKGASSAD